MYTTAIVRDGELTIETFLVEKARLSTSLNSEVNEFKKCQAHVDLKLIAGPYEFSIINSNLILISFKQNY